MQDTRDNTEGVQWEATLSKSLVVSLQTGYWDFDSTYLTFGDFNRPSTIDIATQYVTGPSTTQGNIPFEDRYHTKGNATWYRPTASYGNHEVKVGFDYIRNLIARGWNDRGNNFNYQLQFSNGQPFQLVTWNYPVVPRSRVNNLGFYLRDNWTIARRLTLNLGARYLHDQGFVPQQCRQDANPPAFAPAACFDRVDLPVWNSLAPRVYVAYDVTGRGKTIIKGGWGRFDNLRQVQDVLPFNLNIAADTTWRWHDLNGDHLYQPGEVNLDSNGPDFISRSGRSFDAPFANGVVNLNEQEPKSDQYLVALEQELAGNSAVRMSGMYDRNFNVRRILNTARPYDAYNIPITSRDPGPDGVLGTADDPGTFLTYYDYPAELAGLRFQKLTWFNPPGNDQTFATLEFAATKRLSRGWQLMASYSATKINTPFQTESAYNPNAEINVADHTWEWSGKASSAYIFPRGVTLSVNYNNLSGTPQARQVLLRGGKQVPSLMVNAEPVGSIRLPSTNLLDVRAEKSFRLTSTRRVLARVNVYNALNTSTVTARSVLAGAKYLLPTAIIPPRILEFSGSYSF
jgi:hypothetical protein